VRSDKFERDKMIKGMKVHPCWKSFGEQLEEIRALDEGAAEDCMHRETEAVGSVGGGALKLLGEESVEFTLPGF
jgi:hypothetical protein